MERSNTLNEAKREIKEMELTTHHLKIEVCEDEGKLDIYLNAYSAYSDAYLDGVHLEEYDLSESKKLEKRVLKLEETYFVIRNDKR